MIATAHVRQADLVALTNTTVLLSDLVAPANASDRLPVRRADLVALTNTTVLLSDLVAPANASEHLAHPNRMDR